MTSCRISEPDWCGQFIGRRYCHTHGIFLESYESCPGIAAAFAHPNHQTPRSRPMRRKILIALAAIAAVVGLSSCSDADVASSNLSKAAENFEINRRVVFLNGITDTYLLSIEGRCSIEDAEGQLEVTCKVSETGYKKHFLGLSDNVSYFVEQLEPAEVDVYHYRVIFKPEAMVPDLELNTSGS